MRWEMWPLSQYWYWHHTSSQIGLVWRWTHSSLPLAYCSALYFLPSAVRLETRAWNKFSHKEKAQILNILNICSVLTDSVNETFSVLIWIMFVSVNLRQIWAWDDEWSLWVRSGQRDTDWGLRALSDECFDLDDSGQQWQGGLHGRHSHPRALQSNWCQHKLMSFFKTSSSRHQIIHPANNIWSSFLLWSELNGTKRNWQETNWLNHPNDKGDFCWIPIPEVRSTTFPQSINPPGYHYIM